MIRPLGFEVPIAKIGRGALTRAQLWGGLNTPEFFFAVAKNGVALRRRFLHSCSDNCSATFLKILGPGHQRSGHQVRSSDPRLRKTLQSRHGHSGGEKDLKLSGFGILPSTYIQLKYLGFFYIGDLRSGQYGDPHHKSMGKNSNASNIYQICSNRSEPCSFRLLLMTSVHLRVCDPRKGHLRSNHDVMRSMYAFAYNF